MAALGPFEPKPRIAVAVSGGADSMTLALLAAGWARKASDGLVGVARFDAEKGATHVLQYLESAPEVKTASPEEIARHIERGGRQLVDKAGIDLLGRVEAAQAQKLGLPSFKFADDEKMLAAIAQERSAPVSAGD